MSRLRVASRLVAGIALCLVLGSVLGGLAAASEVIDPADVQRGDQGYCITEMDGGERLRIPVTVLGVLDATEPDGEVVLVRLDHPRLEHTGIIAGMSGSPVYIDGRLLGAVAFGWPYSKEPIAGVTPFVRMLALADGNERMTAVAGLGGSGLRAPAAALRPSLPELEQASQEHRLGLVLLDWLVPVRRTGMAPLAVSVAVSGGALSAGPGTRGEAWLERAWQRLGWVQTAAAGRARAGSATSGSSAERGREAGAEVLGPGSEILAPGDMVAGVIVDGDAVMAVGGTVTEVRGDQVWALGHPFLGAGSIELPMARAGVVAVLPSQQASFKFFTVGAPIGVFRSDRSFGIWGTTGSRVPMVPIEVVTDEASYSFRSIRHPVLLPLMTSFLVDASCGALGRSFGDQTVSLRAELGYAGDDPVIVEEMFAGADAAAQAASLASAVTAYLETSSFEVAKLQSLRFVVHQEEGLASAEIIDAVPDRPRVRPGSELGVRVRLRPYRGKIVETRLMIRVPGELAADKVDLVVASGGSWSVYDLGMRPGRPASFADEVREVRRLRPATQLVVALEERAGGITLPGGSIAAPAGVVLALQSGLGPSLQTVTHRVLELVEAELPYPILGALRIPLEVEREAPVGSDAPGPAGR